MWATSPRSQSPIWSLVRRYLAQEAPPTEVNISEQLRSVMRNVPQPVALAVARAPAGSSSNAQYHGATLSSFTSLTLHPYPLVAFSLRLPSRLADCIRPLDAHMVPPTSSHRPSLPSAPLSSSMDQVTSPSATFSTPATAATAQSDPSLLPKPAVTISLLSHSHAHLADKFARPGLDMAIAFPPADFDFPKSSKEPPGVKDALGLLHCDVVTSLPLRDIHTTASGSPNMEQAGVRSNPSHSVGLKSGGDEVHGSELFICRVSGVKEGDEGLHIDPLLYWRRKYISVQNQSELPYTW